MYILYELRVIKRAVCKAILSQTIPYYSDWNRSILVASWMFSCPWKPHKQVVSIGHISLVSFVPWTSSSSFFVFNNILAVNILFFLNLQSKIHDVTLPILPFITFHLSLEESTFKLPPFYFTIHCSSLSPDT